MDDPVKHSISVITDREEFLAGLAALPEVHADLHYFLSRDWAQSYISQWPQHEFFIGMRIARTAADGAALLCLSRGTRSSALSAGHRSLGFNESSGAELAQVTTEIGGLLGGSSIKFSESIDDILGQLVGIQGWDELRVNALSVDDARRLARAAKDLGLISHTFSRSETYWVDLNQIRDQFAGNYLTSRSANTRQQLRRALRGLQDKHGRFSLTLASGPAQAHEWLDRLAVMHKKRWNTENESSGFENPHFGRFHHGLVSAMLERGEIEILRASAGDEAFAYLYNFVSNGRVYFSMSGVEYERFAPYKPGVLAHWQAIEWYQSRGLNTYDFMAGTSQYKQSLCTHSKAQETTLVRRPLLKFQLEAAARWVKRNLRGQATTAAPG